MQQAAPVTTQFPSQQVVALPTTQQQPVGQVPVVVAPQPTAPVAPAQQQTQAPAPSTPATPGADVVIHLIQHQLHRSYQML